VISSESRLCRSVREFVVDEEAASATEYAVLVALIVVAVTAAINIFNMGGIFTTVSQKVHSCINAVNGVCQ